VLVALAVAILAIQTKGTDETGKPERWTLKRGLDLAGGIRVVLQAEKDKLPKGEKWETKHLNNIIRIVRKRVDDFGVSEPIIQPKGSDQVVVELPAIKDKERALQTIQSTARLEFWHLRTTHFSGATRYRPIAGKYTLTVSRDPETGNDVYRFTDEKGQEVDTATVLKDSRLILTGDQLVPGKSEVVKASNGIGAWVALEFNEQGKETFFKFTRANQGEILAIVLDGKIISAPIIDEAIPSGHAVIRGNFTPREAKQLADLINAGALPVPLKIIQIQSVEATLGKESVSRSIQAGVIGLAAVALFMLLYYLLPGLVADIALGIYALLTLAAFKLFGVTLTLPGIAAYILSIGMAVDANILIFERLKEELRSGKTLRAAIDAGFSRAFTSIFDSNMCSLITCFILGWLGTGPIRGFAIVLAMGVLISMFTAITVTRTILHLIVGTRLGESPRAFGVGRQWVTGRTGRQFDIVGHMKVWFAISALVLIPGLYYWLGAHQLKLGIDFTGGSLTQVEFHQPVPASTISKVLSKNGFPEALVQRSTDDPRIVFIRTKNVIDNPVLKQRFEKVKSELGKLGGKIQSSEEVGATISKELTANAIKAVVLASIAIVLYLSARFAIGGFKNGLKFGVCAILATLHDVGVIIGVFAILGRFLNWEIDSLFVTAVLTIIGFSTHDTIVIFDRIRENLRNKSKGETFESVVNKSILQSFARSINTSLTVVLTLVALLLFGARNIHHFVTALLIGVVSGTYSSIFNASQLVVVWQRLSEKRSPWGVPVEKESARAVKAQELKPLAAGETSKDGDEDVASAVATPAKSGTNKTKVKKRKKRF
jgi:SecD/SecF fusion protein